MGFPAPPAAGTALPFGSWLRLSGRWPRPAEKLFRKRARLRRSAVLDHSVDPDGGLE